MEPKQTVTSYCNQKREKSPRCFHYDTVVFNKAPIEMTIHGFLEHLISLMVFILADSLGDSLYFSFPPSS